MEVAPWQLSTWSSPPRCMMDWHGLMSLRMVCKAHSCAVWTGMISTYRMLISHVSDNHQIGRVFLEVITSSTCGQRRWCIHTMT